jgi:ubiquinone/menaquinone biosynthesis C-methylase UbiE
MQPQAFDTYAKSYDVHFTNSLIGKAQRDAVHRHLEKVIDGDTKQMLEVNCGTGYDALWFSNKGIQVLATDISQGMLEEAKKKKHNGNMEFRQLSSTEIGTLAPQMYDLIFSNFGGLNCLNRTDLIKFKNGCCRLQQKNAQLAFVIMGTKCWWERFYFSWKKEKIKAGRRIDPAGAETVIEGQHFKTWYHSPELLKQVLEADYKHISTKPIGLFVPPSYLEEYINNKRKLFGFLKLMDSIFGNISFLSNYADHYLIVFKKK